MATHAGSVKVRTPLVHEPWTARSAPVGATESLTDKVALYGMMAIAVVGMVLIGWFLLVP